MFAENVASYNFHVLVFAIPVKIILTIKPIKSTNFSNLFLE